MSDTPRTDAEWYKATPAYGSPEVVTAEFARELERELAEALASDARKTNEINTLVKENRALRPAARLGLTVLREARDELADIDGGWLEEVAEQYGLLHTVTMTEPCGDHCHCAEYDDEWPTACLRMTPETLALEKEFGDD